MPWLAKTVLKSCHDGTLERFDTCFVTLVERPLFDAFRFDEAGLGQHAKVLAHCWVADLHFLCNQGTANAIPDKVTI